MYKTMRSAKLFRKILNVPTTKGIRLTHTASQLQSNNFFKPMYAGLIDKVLTKYQVYGSHVFEQGPHTVENQQLKSIVDNMKIALASDNLDLIGNLAVQIPTGKAQRTYVTEQLKSSSTLVGNLTFNQQLDFSLKQLQTQFNNVQLSLLLRTLFYQGWYLGAPSYHDSILAPLDQLIIRNVQNIDFGTCCLYFHVKLRYGDSNSELLKQVLLNTLPKSATVADLMALSVLLPPFTNLIHTSLDARDFQTIKSILTDTTISNSSAMFQDINLLALVCRAFSTINGGFTHLKRSLVSLMWEVLVHHMKHYQESELSLALSLCLDQASASVARQELESYPYVVHKYLSSMETILPKVCKLSTTKSVTLFSQMMKSRHIDFGLTEWYLEYLKTANWKSCPTSTIASAILTIGNYGSTDSQVYKPLLQQILSPQCLKKFESNTAALCLTLIGLSYVNVFPHSLYQLLFQQVATSSPKSLQIASVKNLVYLDSAVSLLSPSYAGPKLDKTVVENFSKQRQQPRPFYLEIAKEMMDCIHTLPAVTSRYLVEHRRLLPHSSAPEVVLSTMSESQKSVAILVQPHSEFLKVFHKKSNRHKQVSLEQSGEQRAHIAQLEALGFTVIIINYNEFQGAQNRSQYIMEKLSTSQVV